MTLLEVPQGPMTVSASASSFATWCIVGLLAGSRERQRRMRPWSFLRVRKVAMGTHRIRGEPSPWKVAPCSTISLEGKGSSYPS